jgi:hypothetical protein
MAKIYSIILGVLLVSAPSAFAQAAANLSFSTATSTVAVNERIVVTVNVSSSQSLNAISGDILVPPGSFVIDSVSKSGSVLNFWVTEPTFTASTGVIHFEGVTLGGFQGSGKVLSITMHPKQSGTGTLAFKSAQVLANDGQGTMITGSLGTKAFTINAQAPVVQPKPVKTIPKEKTESVPESVEVIEKPQVPPTLTAPEIMLGAKYGEPAIIGSSQYPKSQILVTFVDSQGSKVFITGDAGDDGSFIVLVPRALRGGAYTVTAVAVKSDGTHSLSSREINVTVGTNFFAIDWKVKAGGLSIVAMLIVFGLYRLVNHKKRTVRGVEHTVHDSFEVLREDITDLSKGKTPTERKKITSIKHDLDDAEDLIVKEVKDLQP